MREELETWQLVERSIMKKYRKELWKPFIAAVKRYELIRSDDRIAVCISGGKDSMLMAKLMQLLRRFSDVPFDLVFLVMDPGYNALNRQKIEANAALLHIPINVSRRTFLRWRIPRTVPLAIYAPGCAGGTCTPKQRSWAATRSPWGII